MRSGISWLASLGMVRFLDWERSVNNEAPQAGIDTWREHPYQRNVSTFGVRLPTCSSLIRNGDSPIIILEDALLKSLVTALPLVPTFESNDDKWSDLHMFALQSRFEGGGPEDAACNKPSDTL